MRRGEIYRYHPQGEKPRPVLVLTRSSAIGYLSGITIAEITTTIRQAPTSVLIDPEDGLDEPCVVNLFALRTVSKDRLKELIGRLDDSKIRQVERGLLYAFAMDDYHL